MFTKKSVFRMFSVLLVVLMMSGTASARPLQATLGTDFTYQGKLTDGGAPANGLYDFEFKLYDDLSVGTQVGSTVPLGDVTVTNGLFTVQLDFGAVFDGTALFLDIGVRPGASVGAYTTLTPRQALTATPYAITAWKAPWSGLSGVPAGFADGVDNVAAAYQNVKSVAKSGGDFTTITAALNSITDASTSNRYLVRVAPGVYNERVTMKPFVDIEGAGELTTTITFAGSAAFTGTLLGANDAELRFLTVENTGGTSYAIAIYDNSGAAPRLTHVTASASGGTYNYGVANSTSSPRMTDVSASASGGSVSYGVFNISTSSPRMTDVSASASGGTDNRGVYNNSSSPTMTNVTASASGGTYSYGVFNFSSSSPTMTGVSASASGGTTSNYGVYNDSSSPTINNSLISASGGTSGNYGITNSANGGTYTVRVNNSQISGSSNTIVNDTEFTTRVGASQLSGGAAFNPIGGTVSCVGVYDENYASAGYTTCP